ncbi:3560_t:CDS:1, partial [Scutellospora calospora]
MSLAGALEVGIRDKNGELEYNHDIQDFENLLFRIKIETLPNEENSARLFFVNKNDEKEITVPKGIKCKDVTFKKNVLKSPLPLTQYFLITHLMKYVIYYDPEKGKTTKRTKIYSVNSQKKFNIHNFKKTTEILENE